MAIKKILIVDDSPTERHVLNDMLTKAGYEVVTSDNGEDAILKAKSLKPDLILMDVVMPGLNGFETAAMLKQQSWAHAATFVAHTAASQTLRRAATAAGFHHFLVKGNAVSEFDAIVEHLLIDDPGRLRS